MLRETKTDPYTLAQPRRVEIVLQVVVVEERLNVRVLVSQVQTSRPDGEVDTDDHPKAQLVSCFSSIRPDVNRAARDRLDEHVIGQVRALRGVPQSHLHPRSPDRLLEAVARPPNRPDLRVITEVLTHAREVMQRWHTN